MRSRQWQIVWGLLGLISAVSSAHANGFSVLDKGAIPSGLNNAGATARAGDGSTVYFNPAGMTRLPAMWQVGIDTTTPEIDTRNTGSTAATPGTGGNATPFPGPTSNDPIDATPVPHLYAVYPLAQTDVWLGLAVTVPFGLAVEYSDDWFGRYDSVESDFTTVDIAPSVAWRVADAFSIGGGIDVQYADGTLRNALPDPLNPGGPTPATDGMSSLKGDDWSLGFNVGVLWEPAAHVRIGAHYRSAIDHTLDGELEVKGLSGPLAAFNGRQSGTTAINLPDVASLGLAFEWSDQLTTFAEGNWYGWNRFEEIRATAADGTTAALRPQNYSNTWAVAAGIEYRLNPQWQIRSGLRYEETPTNDQYRSTSIPDEQAVTVAIGASMQLTEQMSIDAAYQRFISADSNINNTSEFYSGTPLQSAVNTRAELQPLSNVISLDLRFEYQ